MQRLPFDAVLLAGGRASRLGGADKTAFTAGGRTLLDLALEAAQDARATAVVGLRPGTASPPRAILTRESPPWSGPVAALGAGLRALEPSPSSHTLVLACDLPRAPGAVRALLRGARLDHRASEAFGCVALDEGGRRQPILALYRTAPLAARLAELGAGDGSGLVGLSFRRLLDGADLVEVPMAPGLAADVDTADDAQRLGVSGGAEAPAG